MAKNKTDELKIQEIRKKSKESRKNELINIK